MAHSQEIDSGRQYMGNNSLSKSILTWPPFQYTTRFLNFAMSVDQDRPISEKMSFRALRDCSGLDIVGLTSNSTVNLIKYSGRNMGCRVVLSEAVNISAKTCSQPYPRHQHNGFHFIGFGE